MERIRAEQFRIINGQYTPFIVRPGRPDIYRQVFLTPQPGSVEAFLRAPETEVLLSGPRGPGKTVALASDFLQDVDAGWGAHWVGYIFRRTQTGFDNFRNMTNRVIGTICPGATFNQNANRWNFPGGEVLYLRYFDSDLDFQQYQGAEMTWLALDELTQWENDAALRMLTSCLRTPVPAIPSRVRSATNPDGPGHTWVKHRYQCSDFFAMNDYIIGPRVERDKDGPDRRVIYARLLENLVLLHASPDYQENLKTSANDEGRYAGWINGSWSILSGDLLGDVWNAAKDYATLPSIPAHLIPPSYKIDRAFDWGDAHPFAHLWFAESDGTPITVDGRTFRFLPGDLILFAEWFGQGGRPNVGLRLPTAMVRDGIIQREIDMGLRMQDVNGKWRCRVSAGPADNQIFALKPGAGGSEPVGSIADDFEAPTTINGHRFHGIRWEESNKDPGSRVQAWQALRSRISATIPTKDGARERSGLYVCENVRSFFDHVVTLPRDLKNNREDTPKDGLNDHTAAALRYRLLFNSKPRMRSYSMNDLRRH